MLSRQSQLLLVAAKSLQDYRAGLRSLGELIRSLDGVMALVEEAALKDSVFNAQIALEEVYARTLGGDLDFERDGRPVVERAVDQISSVLDAHLSEGAEPTMWGSPS
jgi:hypothetical protein